MALPWQDIDCVLFDMDGTLLDLHFDNYFWLDYLPQCYAEQNGLPLSAAREKLHGLFAHHAGTLNWYCTDFWSRELDLPVVALKQQVASRIAARDGCEAFLEAAQRAGKRLILATNAHRDSLALKMQRVPLAHCFERLVSSHDYGFPKEDARFWTALTAELALNPARCLLIDDSLAVLRSAQRFGIGHLRAVARPDSRAPAKDTEEFADGGDFPALLGGLAGIHPMPVHQHMAHRAAQALPDKRTVAPE